MSELNNHKQLLIAYKSTFASKKKIKDPENWYPSSAKEIESLLKEFLKDIPIAKKYENELNDFLNSSYAQVIEADMTIRAKKREDHKDWLFENRKVWRNSNTTNSQFAYYKSKIQTKLGNAFGDIDASTDSILSDLEDPTRGGKWETYGMVVGDVQSGKTSNYTGLIAKAIDTGYKVIIVLTGLHNSLRAQTQKRLDDNLISTAQKGDCNRVFFATKKPKYHWPEGIRTVQVENDFDLNTAKKISITSKDPIILVVKKIVPVLSSILVWLNTQKGMPINKDKEWKWTESKWRNESIRNDLPKHQLMCPQPMLMIDDECDTASLDISVRKSKKPQHEMTEEELDNFRKSDPSKTNQLIRKINQSFERSAYVGYTATPLANAFINYTSFTEDEGLDIFPRDFIKLLPRYDAHIGPEDVFGVAEKNYDPENEIVSLSEQISKDEKPQVKWLYDYRDDFDSPEFSNEDGSFDEKARDEKYRKEGKKGEDEVKGWLPLYHGISHQCSYKEENTIPNSLKEAINTFLINIAIKSFRIKEIQHNSMLIHVSRFTNVQNLVMGQIRTYLNDLRKNITYGQDKNTAQSIKNEFKNIWENDTKKNIDKIKYPKDVNINFDLIWDIILSVLTQENKKIDLIRINSTSDDNLAYEEKGNGWNVIVVGGAALSRGITLEGLSVTYFLRIAKIPTSDTLIQMGRWFGYRKGYEDLWRVYCPKTLHILFRQFSFTMEKAREKFADLMDLGLSPKDYAVEVPCFSGWNLVSKTKSKDISIIKEPFSSFSAKNHTPIVYYSNEDRLFNIKITNDLINKLPDRFEKTTDINSRILKDNIWIPDPIKGGNENKINKDLTLEEIKETICKNTRNVKIKNGYLWKNIDIKLLIKYFSEYKSPPTMRDWTTKIIAAQIGLLNKYNKVNQWNIGIYSSGDLKNSSEISFKDNKIKIPLQQRTAVKPAEIFSISTLQDPSAEFLDINKETFEKGVDSWIRLYKKTGKSVLKRKSVNWLPDSFKPKIRQQRKEGLFIIYPWTTKFKDKGFDLEKDVYIGWQIIIPATREEGDEDQLIYNVAMNEAAREHRMAEYKEYFDPDLYN
tara:strand:+ start:1672 stop:4908 length:3237 start_codon:yes stop_codon:yes gene_type:complete